MPRQTVPASLLTADRAEHTDLSLNVDGAVPAGLGGHVFFVAPVGTPAAPGLPNPRGNTVMNGDGMICRLDFGSGGPRITTRLARTPDQIADAVTHADPSYRVMRFGNLGIARTSAFLGARDFLNTAFLPMDDGSGGPTRLLVTYDAGRPFEVDTSTLEVVTPIGAAPEWRPSTLEDMPFPLFLSAAHPVWDPSSAELFSVNYSRSLESAALSVPILNRFLRIAPSIMVDAVENLADGIGIGVSARREIHHLGRVWRKIRNRFNDLVGLLPNVPEDFTYLVRWDGSGPLRRYRLYDEHGLRIRIRQSVHQLAVTQNWVVILDTGFKVGPDQWFNDPIPETDVADRLARSMLTKPQAPDTIVYLVRRSDLDAPVTDVDEDGKPIVTARVVRFPIEADHFVADYDDPGDELTLHVGHAAATDLSEWVRNYDRSPVDGARPGPNVRGMMAVGAMDVNRFGRHVIDANKGCVRSDYISRDQLTWALALYAGPGQFGPTAPPGRVDHLYWVSEGFFTELLTQFVYELYDRYPHRIISLSRILEIAETEGRNAAIVHLDTRAMEIAGHYHLPDDHMVGSMQFVPASTGGPTAGWLVCTVYTPARTEIWILDAADLASGPVAKLHHPTMKIGFSLHTTWLPSVGPRTATYAVSAAQEYGNRSEWSSRVERFMDDHVIPDFWGP